MSTDNTNRDTGTTSYEQRGSSASGSSAGSSSSGGGSQDLNFGSARSDYGSNAYGGRLDKTGLESGSGGSADYDRQYSARGRGGFGRSSFGKKTRRGADAGMSAGLAFLSGAALGATLMYILDPERGRSRRAYLSDKVTSATNRAGQTISRTSRDLGNRAQGLMAETGLRSGGKERDDAPERAGAMNTSSANPLSR